MSECRQCKIIFTPRRTNQAYCSAQCKWTWNNTHRTQHPNIIAECAVCGNPFSRYVEPSRLKSGKAKGIYCSRKCKGVALSGPNHPMWKGGRCLVNGYIWIHCPKHPNAKHQGYVLEHRLVMERMLGRYLSREEVVHHRDEDTTNNTESNLELFDSNSTHKKESHEEQRSRNASGQYLPVGA